MNVLNVSEDGASLTQSYVNQCITGIWRISRESVIGYHFNYNECRFVFQNQEYQDIWDQMIEKILGCYKIPAYKFELLSYGIDNEMFYENSSSNHHTFPLQSLLTNYFIYVKPENWRLD